MPFKGDGRGLPPGSTGLDLLDHELLAEKAAALGRTAGTMEKALRALDASPPGEAREIRLRIAADAVYAFFIQRELCGMRRHDEVIRHYRIPKQVLVRLGAR